MTWRMPAPILRERHDTAVEYAAQVPLAIAGSGTRATAPIGIQAHNEVVAPIERGIGSVCCEVDEIIVPKDPDADVARRGRDTECGRSILSLVDTTIDYRRYREPEDIECVGGAGERGETEEARGRDQEIEHEVVDFRFCVLPVGGAGPRAGEDWAAPSAATIRSAAGRGSQASGRGVPYVKPVSPRAQPSRSKKPTASGCAPKNTTPRGVNPSARSISARPIPRRR